MLVDDDRQRIQMLARPQLRRMNQRSNRLPPGIRISETRWGNLRKVPLDEVPTKGNRSSITGRRHEKPDHGIDGTGRVLRHERWAAIAWETDAYDGSTRSRARPSGRTSTPLPAEHSSPVGGTQIICPSQ